MRRWLVLALLILSAAGWLLGWSPYLKAKSVLVEGVTTLSAQQVIRVSGVRVGTPLARVNGARVERALTSIPRIGSVRIIRGWPDTITIQIVERDPVAMVGSLAVDRSGFRFPLAAGEKRPLIKISNFTPERFQVWREIYRELPASIKKSITDVTLDGKDDIWFATGELTVVWGSGEENQLKARVLKELLARPTTFSRIDLSAPLAPTTLK